MLVGPVAGDAGFYSTTAAPLEQRAPPVVRGEQGQPIAYNTPPARPQPPPAEEDVNDYDSDEASEYMSVKILGQPGHGSLRCLSRR